MKIIAIVIVVALVMYTVVGGLKKSTYKKLVTYLQNGDFKTFYTEIDSGKVKLLFPKLSILDLKLNASIIESNKSATTKYFEEIMANPLTNSQKENYYMKAFNYYVGAKDKKHSKKYLDLINSLDNERMQLEANRVYNIYILKNDKDLKQLLEELEDMEDYQKGAHEYLISIIYKNLNDTANAKKYEELSKQHFSIVDEQTRLKQQKK